MLTIKKKNTLREKERKKRCSDEGLMRETGAFVPLQPRERESRERERERGRGLWRGSSICSGEHGEGENPAGEREKKMK